jgi:hypothetical protein
MILTERPCDDTSLAMRRRLDRQLRICRLSHRCNLWCVTVAQITALARDRFAALLPLDHGATP